MIGVLAVTYRHAPTATRAALAARDNMEDAPSAALLKAGHARGVVRAETCSRIEWIVSADNPEWALQLLDAAFVARGAMPAHTAHHYLSDEAMLRVMSVAAGLDSVAEGEAAVS